MEITKEQALRELERRGIAPEVDAIPLENKITKEQALRELERRGIAPEAPQAIERNRLDSFAAGLADSATFGTAPNIEAGITTAFNKLTGQEKRAFLEAYPELRDKLRKEDEELFNANPKSYLAGGLAGAIANPIPLGKGSLIKQGIKAGTLYELGKTDYDLEKSPEENAARFTTSGAKGATLGAATGALGKYVAGKIAKKPKMIENPLQLGQKRVADAFDVPLSRGNIKGDHETKLFEELALRGEFGENNQKYIKGFRELQDNKFQQAVGKVDSGISGAKSDYKGELINTPVDKIKSQAAKEKKEYINLYEDIKKNHNEVVYDKGIMNFIPYVTQKLERNLKTIDNAPKTYNELSAFARIFKGQKFDESGKEVVRKTGLLNEYGDQIEAVSRNPDVTIDFNLLEAWRQGLNDSIAESARAGQFKDNKGLTILKKDFDYFLDSLTDSRLFKGDPKLLPKLKEARDATRKWYNKYDTNDDFDHGKNFISKIISDRNNHLTGEELANEIFGASEHNFSDKAPAIVKELGAMLGKNSPEFRAVKSEATRRILEPLYTVGKNNHEPSFTKYLSNLDKLKSTKNSLVEELYTPKEMMALDAIGKLGKQVYAGPSKSKVNPPDTAFTKHLIEKFAKKIPFVGEALGLIKTASKNSKASKRLVEHIESPVEKIQAGEPQRSRVRKFAEDKTPHAINKNPLTAKLNKPNEEKERRVTRITIRPPK